MTDVPGVLVPGVLVPGVLVPGVLVPAPRRVPESPYRRPAAIGPCCAWAAAQCRQQLGRRRRRGQHSRPDGALGRRQPALSAPISAT
jgi:hypothetical protein